MNYDVYTSMKPAPRMHSVPERPTPPAAAQQLDESQKKKKKKTKKKKSSARKLELLVFPELEKGTQRVGRLCPSPTRPRSATRYRCPYLL